MYGSKTWCLQENETAILKRTGRTMTRAMREVKFLNTFFLINLLDLEETLDRLAKMNGMQ